MPRKPYSRWTIGIGAAIAGLTLGLVGPATADHPGSQGTGVTVPTLVEHNALEARVADLEDRLDELETPDPTPTSTPTETPTEEPTETPTETSTPTDPPAEDEFPTPQTTGPRQTPTRQSGSITTTKAGQVIENVEITGRLTIRHSNVIVRDVIVNGTTTYMIYVDDLNGKCPTNVLIEHVELDGAQAAENDIPIYMPCGATIDHAYVHNVGRTSRLVHNGTIQNSWIYSNRTGDSGAHRGGAGTNGGSNNKLINNVLRCSGKGCSAAIPMYGDFSPVNGFLVKHNLLATTGSYCAYGGSVDSKTYPDASDVKFIDNHFSKEFFNTCGRYGHISAFERGVRGNEWSGNVWHESGEPIP